MSDVEVEIPEKLRREIEELARTGKITPRVTDKRRLKPEDVEAPGWFKRKTKPKPAPQDELDRVIQQQVVADAEIRVHDYVHKPNQVIPNGMARVVLFKDGRVAILTSHVGFFVSPEDVDFIAGLSQGQRETADDGQESE